MLRSFSSPNFVTSRLGLQGCCSLWHKNAIPSESSAILGPGPSSPCRVVVPCAAIHHHKERHNLMQFLGVIRSNPRKAQRHMDPKFRKLRGQKFIKIDLPDFEKFRDQDKWTPDEIRAELKKQGIPPHRPWRERPINISCTGEIMEPYEPEDYDGKASRISMSLSKLKNPKQLMKDLWFRHRRQIRKTAGYEDWNETDFAQEAEQIFIAAHNALQDRDEETLHDLVTEHAFPQMWDQLKLRSIRWEWVERLEPPRVVHIRTSPLAPGSTNTFSQVTVRMNTRQKLAIFDQFGRLMLGDEETAKQVVEYVVFENHLNNQYGSWRIHAKVTGKSELPKETPVIKTFKKEESELFEEFEDEEEDETSPKKIGGKQKEQTKELALA